MKISCNIAAEFMREAISTTLNRLELSAIELDISFIMHKLDTLLRINDWVVRVGTSPLLTSDNVAAFVERTWLVAAKGGYTYGKGMGTYYPPEAVHVGRF